jgi:TonB family protein
MTFQRSLYISFGIHILIFGTALAFAQYGGGLLGGNFDSTTVALVGSGELTGPQRPKSSVERTARISRDVVQSNRSTRPQDKQPEENGSDGERIEQQGDGPGSGQGPGAGFGLFSPAQWQLVQAALERAKSYPRMARERGIQGVVRLKFRLRPSGEVESVEVVQSSGHEILDAASVRTVFRAGPLPYIQGWVEVPMSYVLK